jgi:hypothetical protein
MEFANGLGDGLSTYSTELEDTTTVTETDNTENDITYGMTNTAGFGVELEFSVCVGGGVVAITLLCKHETAVTTDFSVALTTKGGNTIEDGDSTETGTAKSTAMELGLPAVALGAKESTMYTMTVFKKKLTDITVQVVKKMMFEDGTSVLMPPQPIKISGVVVTNSMSSFQRMVRGVKGCSAILEPVVPDN